MPSNSNKICLPVVKIPNLHKASRFSIAKFECHAKSSKVFQEKFGLKREFFFMHFGHFYFYFAFNVKYIQSGCCQSGKLRLFFSCKSYIVRNI